MTVLEWGRNRKDVSLSYAIGSERLDLVVKPRSLWAEFQRQAFGSSRRLLTEMENALASDARS